MPNNISLTIRLPHDLNMQLQSCAQELGVTKTNLLRGAVHDFLTVDGITLNFSAVPGTKDRLVLNVNQITYNILESACEKHGQSVNAVVTAIGLLAVERSAKWLEAIKQ